MKRSYHSKYFKLDLLSYTSPKLTKKKIVEICVLKNQYWKFGLKSQINFFKRNIKKEDIHNLLLINSILVGYTLLRKRTCKLFVNNSNKRIKYFLLDTLIIRKQHQHKNFSNVLMNFNNKIIKKSKCLSFLMCNDRFVEFYKQYKWTKISNQKINVLDYSFSTNAMIFNKKIKNIKKYFFYINR